MGSVPSMLGPWLLLRLIEVVIAVGLVAFVLTAILGLVAIAANETKNADLKARLAWITEQVTSEYQSQRFSNALASLPTNWTLDYEGMPVPTNSPNAYFVCDVSNVTPTNATNPSYPTNYIALLQVRTRWPYSSQLDKFRLHKCQRHLALQLPIGGLFG